jgi:hypothetical protein
LPDLKIEQPKRRYILEGGFAIKNIRRIKSVRLDPAISGHKIVTGGIMTIRLREAVRARRGCNAKLSEAEVLEIFKARGRIAQSELGRKYGVTQGQISQVHRGTSWSWLTRSVKDDGSTADQT